MLTALKHHPEDTRHDFSPSHIILTPTLFPCAKLLMLSNNSVSKEYRHWSLWYTWKKDHMSYVKTLLRYIGMQNTNYLLADCNLRKNVLGDHPNIFSTVLFRGARAFLTKWFGSKILHKKTLSLFFDYHFFGQSSKSTWGILFPDTSF